MLGNFMMGFNLNSNIFKNKNLRKAIQLCIDRSKVVEGVNVRNEFISETIIPFGLTGYIHAESNLNIKLAKNYLRLVPIKQYPLVKDMVIHLPKNPHAMAIFAIKEINIGLVKIGLPPLIIKEIDIDYGKGKIGNYYKFLRENDFNLYMRGHIATIPSPLYIIKENILEKSPMNFSNFNNKEIASDIFELETRKKTEEEVFRNISQIIRDEVPFIVLGNLFYNPASRKDNPLVVHAISPNYINFNSSIER